MNEIYDETLSDFDEDFGYENYLTSMVPWILLYLIIRWIPLQLP